MRLSTRIRRLAKRYERALMIAVIILLLVIFTVTGTITSLLRGGNGGRSGSDVAGSFEILPGQRREVTWNQFQAKANAMRLFNMVARPRGSPDVDYTEVWIHLVLGAAADREHITIPTAMLRNQLKQLPIGDDPAKYRLYLSHFGIDNPAEFENEMRAEMREQIVRSVFQHSFLFAPPESREKLVQDYLRQDLGEFDRVSWAALDAQRFVKQARDELNAAKDPAAMLQDFYENNAAVAAEPAKFQLPRRYSFEILYTLHKAVESDDAYDRLQDLVHKAFPDYDMKRLDVQLQTPEGQKQSINYFGSYEDRLLKDAGLSVKKIREDIKKDPANAKLTGNKLESEVTTRAQAAVMPQVLREQKVRMLYQFILLKYAKEHPKESLDALYQKLAAHDDPKDPVLSKEPGKGLLVFRKFDHPISGEDIGALEDRGVRFTINVRSRINDVAEKGDLPRLSPNAQVMGEAADGRMIYRVLSMEKPRRKQFSELTTGEKDVLRDSFYLPDVARQRAKSKLQELKKKADKDKLTSAQFLKLAKEYGARTYDDQWITVGGQYREAPDKDSLWPDQFRLMQDRYFLRKTLFDLVAGERAPNAKKLTPPVFLDVKVDSRNEETDPGAAYLVLLEERKPKTFQSIPTERFDRFIDAVRNRDLRNERAWWDASNFKAIAARFSMQFGTEMEKTIQHLEERKKPKNGFGS